MTLTATTYAGMLAADADAYTRLQIGRAHV